MNRWNGYRRREPTAKRRVVALLSGLVGALFVGQAPASACNVPVFRYALERWQPDAYRITVTCEGRLSAEDQSWVDGLRASSVEQGGSLNCTVTVDAGDSGSQSENEAAAPQARVSIELPAGRGRSLTVFAGPLAEVRDIGLQKSPVRDELVRRLLSGDSAVWLVVKGRDAKPHARVMNVLENELERLGDALPFPEGVGEPGSELFSEVPLTIRFSVLEVDPADPRERFLVHLLTGFRQDAVERGESLVVPVFGRGRALEVIPAERVGPALVEQLSGFLCGACSCQVKDSNPGFDLLLSVPWEARLFEAGAPIPPPAAAGGDRASSTLVPIPPGRAGKDAQMPHGRAASADGRGNADLPRRMEPGKRVAYSGFFWSVAVWGVCSVLIAAGAKRRTP